MEKYLEVLKKAKKEGRKVNILEFYEMCKEDGYSPPKVMREVIKNGLQDVLVK